MNNKKKFWQTLALISTLIAVGVHIYLTVHYFELKLGLAAGKSLCNINQIFNCDTVSTSKYSAIFGIPMALFGAVTNFFLAITFLCSRLDWSQEPEKLGRYSFYLSAFVALTSVVMASISTAILGQVCLFCLAAYLLSAITVIGSFLSAEKVSISNFTEDALDIFQESKWFLILLVAIPSSAWLGKNIMIDSYGATGFEQMVTEQVQNWKTTAVKNFTDEGLVITKGSGQFVIVEFADFLCPHCKHAVPTLHAFTDSHPDVKLVFKPFPLDGKCNPDPMLQGRGDGVRCDLAAAVYCAEKLGQKGWQAHGFIFDNQENIYRVQNIEISLADIAKQFNFEFNAFKTCVKSDEAFKWIQRVSQEGINGGVQGTPTIFVNGKLLNGGQMLPTLESAYRETH